jgi:type II secretory pathway pseudopilin PulG
MKKSNDKPPRSQLGATLLETIIAIGILGAVVGAASTYFAQSGSTLRFENLKEMQGAIVGRLQSALANPEVINKTLDFAPPSTGLNQLKACILGTSTCVATAPASSWTFDLLDANVDPSTGKPIQLAGGLAGYDMEGNPCKLGSPKCIFGTEVKFWATCPLDTAKNPTPLTTCPRAQYLNFKFQVRVPDAKQLFKSKGLKLPNFPSDADYNGAEPMSAVRVRVADVLARRGGACGKPEDYLRMVGLDKEGKPICRCIDGSSKTPCKPVICAKNEIMIGFKEVTTKDKATGVNITTLQPQCLKQKDCEDLSKTLPDICPCTDVDLGASGKCAEGFWMVGIQYGECSATTEKDKGGPETVKCTGKKGRCCKLDVQ